MNRVSVTDLRPGYYWYVSVEGDDPAIREDEPAIVMLFSLRPVRSSLLVPLADQGDRLAVQRIGVELAFEIAEHHGAFYGPIAPFKEGDDWIQGAAEEIVSEGIMAFDSSLSEERIVEIIKKYRR